MKNEQTFMQAAVEIGIESLRTTARGLVNKGPLVGVLLLVLTGVIVFAERERTDFRRDMREQKAQMDTLKAQMDKCMELRIQQAAQIAIQTEQINELRQQVTLLITPNTNARRKK